MKLTKERLRLIINEEATRLQSATPKKAMKLSHGQLRSLVGQVMKESPNPPKGTTLKTRATARAMSEHPKVNEAVEQLVGALNSALSEMIDDEDEMEMMDQSIHTDFYNDVMDLVDNWMNMYAERQGRGGFE